MRKKASRIAVIDCAPGCGKTAITFKKPTLESLTTPVRWEAERFPSPASARTRLVDREGFVTHSNLQNRPDSAGQVHGVVRRICCSSALFIRYNTGSREFPVENKCVFAGFHGFRKPCIRNSFRVFAYQKHKNLFVFL